MILVVFLHAYNLKVVNTGQIVFNKSFTFFVEDFFSYGITRIAVPLFFIISGFLFFKNKPSYKVILTQIIKRFKTLIIPYFLCAFLGIIIYFVLQNIPQSKSFFNSKLVSNFTFSDWVNAIFVLPIPYQLWFLRDLIILVFLSPLLLFLLNYLNVWLILLSFTVWMIGLNTTFLTGESLFFFITGAYTAVYLPKVLLIKNNKGNLFIVLWIAFMLLKQIFNFFDFSENLEFIILKISILFGIIAFWHIYDIFHNSFNHFSKFVPYSFFIYLVHEPLLTIIKKSFFFALPKTELNYLLAYFVTPTLTIIICIWLGILVKRYCLPVYNMFTGNR